MKYSKFNSCAVDKWKAQNLPQKVGFPQGSLRFANTSCKSKNVKKLWACQENHLFAVHRGFLAMWSIPVPQKAHSRRRWSCPRRSLPRPRRCPPGVMCVCVYFIFLLVRLVEWRTCHIWNNLAGHPDGCRPHISDTCVMDMFVRVGTLTYEWYDKCDT